MFKSSVFLILDYLTGLQGSRIRSALYDTRKGLGDSSAFVWQFTIVYVS